MLPSFRTETHLRWTFQWQQCTFPCHFGPYQFQLPSCGRSKQPALQVRKKLKELLQSATAPFCYASFTTVRAALLSVSVLPVLFTTVRVCPTAPTVTMVFTVRGCGSVAAAFTRVCA